MEQRPSASTSLLLLLTTALLGSHHLLRESLTSCQGIQRVSTEH